MADYGPTQNESAIIPTDGALWAFAGEVDRRAWRGEHEWRAGDALGLDGLLLPSRRSGLAEHYLGRILYVGHNQKPP